MISLIVNLYSGASWLDGRVMVISSLLTSLTRQEKGLLMTSGVGGRFMVALVGGLLIGLGSPVFFNLVFGCP